MGEGKYGKSHVKKVGCYVLVRRTRGERPWATVLEALVDFGFVSTRYNVSRQPDSL